MPTIRRRREIDANPERIWQVVADPQNLPRWWPAVERVEDADTSAWTSVLRSPKGKLLRADYTRVSVDPERAIEWRQEVDETPFERFMSESTTRVLLEPADGGATLVAIETRQKLRGMARLGGFMVRRATRRQLNEALQGLEELFA
jgi:uncharacterized protein YndB with AHSA1/START domain